MKCKLKIFKDNWCGDNKFKISTEYNTAWINGGNGGLALRFPKRLYKVIDWYFEIWNLESY